MDKFITKSIKSGWNYQQVHRMDELITKSIKWTNLSLEVHKVDKFKPIEHRFISRMDKRKKTNIQQWNVLKGMDINQHKLVFTKSSPNNNKAFYSDLKTEQIKKKMYIKLRGWRDWRVSINLLPDNIVFNVLGLSGRD